MLQTKDMVLNLIVNRKFVFYEVQKMVESKDVSNLSLLVILQNSLSRCLDIPGRWLFTLHSYGISYKTRHLPPIFL